MNTEQQNEQAELTRKRGRQVFTWSVLITAGGAVLIAVGLIVASQYVPIGTIVQTVELAKWPLAIWRIVLFLAIIGGWPRWTAIYASWAGLSEEQRVFMLNYRWRMALWLLVMEAVLSHGVVVNFIDNLTNA